MLATNDAARGDGKAVRIRLLDFKTPPMRAFHLTWMAFFLCFFAWFGIAPLMKVVRDELSLTKDQVGWCIIASVALTIVARLAFGWLCDRIGPRKAYAGLLVLGSLPVMGIAFSHDFVTFLIFRALIGLIGASFVITQYHTTQMFAPNCVGLANATTAGWGNFGGGATHVLMPLIFGFFVATMGFTPATSWRACMIAAGVVCLVAGAAYYFFTQDTPLGNFRDLRMSGQMPEKKSVRGGFLTACRDPRVWVLFVAYALCFGLELTIDNLAALYFIDYFDELKQMDSTKALAFAGLCASVFGGMACVARPLGGYIGDRFGKSGGFTGRVRWLFLVLFGEGVLLILFSQTRVLATAIPTLMLFGLFVHMAAGATFAVVPFVNRRVLGSVAGIVGAGGNVGAVLSGFLFKMEGVTWTTALFVLGVLVTVGSFSSLLIAERSDETEEARGPAAIPALADAT